MHALQLTRPRRFAPVEVPIPELKDWGPGWVLVRQQWALVCGSDVPHFAGTRRVASYPFPVGRPIHECAGTVIESTSRHFSPGELVLAIPADYRGLAEFFVAPESATVALPAELADQDASTLIQPLATVMYGVDRLEGVEDQTVAVIGLGPIGLMFCWLLRQRGAGTVLGIDPSAWRCEMARQWGADATFPSRSLELVHSLSQDVRGWMEPDVCIEAVGHQTVTINDCFELVRRRGTVLAFGVPDDDVYPIQFELFYRKNLHLMAAVAPLWSDYLARARDLFCKHRTELEPLVTHRLPIREAERGYSLAERRPDGVGKVLLDATNW